MSFKRTIANYLISRIFFVVFILLMAISGFVGGLYLKGNSVCFDLSSELINLSQNAGDFIMEKDGATYLGVRYKDGTWLMMGQYSANSLPLCSCAVSLNSDGKWLRSLSDYSFDFGAYRVKTEGKSARSAKVYSWMLNDIVMAKNASTAQSVLVNPPHNWSEFIVLPSRKDR